VPKRSNSYKQAIAIYDKREAVTLEAAIKMVQSFPKRGFDESVELAFNLGIDGRQADQSIRGTVMLPHGTGKEVRIVVITQGDLVKEAADAGADFVGGSDIVEKIQNGWLDFDLVVASPDMMGQVGKLGRILGPRGMMPNPKTGTVTRAIAQAVMESKAGRIEYRADSKSGNNAQAPIGKLSFSESDLLANAKVFSEAILRSRPASAKGQFIKKAVMSSTMGPGIRIDPSSISL
jgi:large subunit ribosomal protein L1